MDGSDLRGAAACIADAQAKIAQAYQSTAEIAGYVKALSEDKRLDAETQQDLREQFGTLASIMALLQQADDHAGIRL